MHDLDEFTTVVLTDLSEMWACASVCVQESHVRTKATGSVLVPDSLWCISVFQPGFVFKIRHKGDDYVLC
jgi:hypothetical protein